jgi:hypothetical protein
VRLRLPTLAAMLLASLLGACGGAVTDGVEPSPRDSTTTTPPGGAVQRASITVRVQIDEADRNLSEAAALSLVGISVRLTRTGATEPPQVGTTDAAGTVRFDNLLEGQYTASAERALTLTEISRLPAADREVSLLAGGGQIALSPPASSSLPVTLAASRRGSLVVSEWYLYLENPTPYNWGAYVEIYNNGDTTAYLDGMLLAVSSWGFMHTDGWAPCDDSFHRAYRHDPQRLWIENAIRFPGWGREYPIAPGESRVYASDAVDHTVAAPGGTQEDLSRAHFEHVGVDSDVDNPLAQNVLSVFNTGNGAGGRGFRPTSPGALMLISSRGFETRDSVLLPPINPTPTGGIPRQARYHWGIRTSEVVDMMAYDFSPAFKSYLATTTFRYQMCLPFLAPGLDRAPADVHDSRVPLAVRRRTLGVDANGRQILMRTGASVRDVETTSQRLTRSSRR